LPSKVRVIPDAAYVPAAKSAAVATIVAARREVASIDVMGFMVSPRDKLRCSGSARLAEDEPTCPERSLPFLW
jgi:hypothetical protein